MSRTVAQIDAALLNIETIPYWSTDRELLANHRLLLEEKAEVTGRAGNHQISTHWLDFIVEFILLKDRLESFFIGGLVAIGVYSYACRELLYSVWKAKE